MVLEPADIAKRLRAARERAGLSGRDLARELGISVSEISKMENGKRRLRVELLPDWCAAVEITLADAFGPEHVADFSRVPFSPHVARLYAELPPDWQAHCQRQVESAHRLYRAQKRAHKKDN